VFVIKSNELNNKIVRGDDDYSDEVKIDITYNLSKK